jgi:hypothetical protein
MAAMAAQFTGAIMIGIKGRSDRSLLASLGSEYIMAPFIAAFKRWTGFILPFMVTILAAD